MKRSLLPPSTLPAWTLANGIIMHPNLTILPSPSGHGTGLLLQKPLEGEIPGETPETTHHPDNHPLLLIPPHLLLTHTHVHQLAATDPDLASLLRANADLAATPRGAILLFLLLQIAHSSPDLARLERRVGTSGSWAEYVQYISDERSLPTFWSEGEKGAMWGTSLARHCGAKSAALRREFEGVVASCEGLWWGGVWGDGDGDGAGCLELADWLVVDAMWRSRAMELSAAPPPSRAGSGGNAGVEGMECLVPIMDMANHHSNARVGYSLLQPPAADWPGDKSTTGNGGDADRLWAGLVFETPIFTDSSSKTPAAMINNNTTKTREEENTEEITISYGSMKGAAEMIFSYGFLDDHDNDNDNDNNDDNDNDNDNDNEIPDARSIMLGWTLPEDDPLRFEKVAALGLEPGIQIYTPVNGMGAVRFVGTAVWAMSINEEDGLRIVGTTAPAEGGDNDDDDVVKMFFKDVRIMSKAHLIDVLAHDRAALVFRARAYGYVYLRIEEEIRRLDVLMQEHFERQALDEGGMDVQASRVEMCAKLRELEYAFLKRALGYYADQLGGLMQHPDVLEYPVLMEKGRELPALTDTELWNRYEGEHDEENRRAYTGSLENSLVELQSEKKSGTAW